MSGFRYPAVTAKDPIGQLAQLKSYLHQLVDQLNKQELSGSKQSAVIAKVAGAKSAGDNGGEPAGFNEIKSLIIKSADIVKAYYEQIDNLLKLSGEYVAEATFPEGSAVFIEETNLAVSANSKAIEQFYTDVQKVIDRMDNVEASITTNAYMRSGLLDYDEETGAPVFGLEVGQQTEIDGEQVFHQFARFTADRLSFYDQNGTEVAYISDSKLYIEHAQITGSFTQGGFVDITRPDDSVVTKWIGGGG